MTDIACCFPFSWMKYISNCLGFFLSRGFRPTREFFTHMETSLLPAKGCFWPTRMHTWPLSSDDSLACNTYCVTGHPFIMVRLTPVVEPIAVELSLSVFRSWVCRSRDSNTLPSACEANGLTDCVTIPWPI